MKNIFYRNNIAFILLNYIYKHDKISKNIFINITFDSYQQ